ncbi:MAG: hypothetical protein R2792_01370 [Saprospiraceae bacterium]
MYLKTYYPLAVAVINNFGGFYNTEYYVHEARMNGATIHPPCVNNSRVLTRITGKEVYLGFAHVKGLERQLMQDLERQRREFGRFRDLEDFARRVSCSVSQLELLIRIGAFRFTGMKKSALSFGIKAGFCTGKTDRACTFYLKMKPKNTRFPNSLKDHSIRPMKKWICWASPCAPLSVY